MIPLGKIVLLAAVLALVSSCTGRPEAPAVRIVGAPVDGAAAWEPLGFDVSSEDAGAPECALGWYLEPRDVDCQITIDVHRVDLLRERAGTNARSFRDQRLVEIDSRTYDDAFGILYALSHESGHILLDTKLHTQGGIMGGSTYVLTDVDRELACKTIHICTE